MYGQMTRASELDTVQRIVDYFSRKKTGHESGLGGASETLTTYSRLERRVGSHAGWCETRKGAGLSFQKTLTGAAAVESH